MNIEKARTILISEILQKIGVSPAKQKVSSDWYYSPFRNEKTPSFKVNKSLNLWYDFGEGKGGDTIELVCQYLDRSGADHTISDALRWLGNMFSTDTSYLFIRQDVPPSDQESSLVLKSVKPLTHMALIRYLERRGISSQVAIKYLREVRIYNSQKHKEYFAAAIKNEEDGYDYRNPYFKGCVKKKAVSFIRGAFPGNSGIHVFEGFIDFLSVLSQRGGAMLEEDVLILNSVSLLKEATAYIRGFGYQTGFTWLDNDEAGRQATKAFDAFFLSEDIRHLPMNKNYAAAKDVNEAHMQALGLKTGP